MKLAQSGSATIWMMSPVSSAPRPSAPAGQWQTVPPAKWPPSRSSSSPFHSGRRSPVQCSMRGLGRMTCSASSACSRIGTS
jgi:hypothetical protein